MKITDILHESGNLDQSRDRISKGDSIIFEGRGKALVGVVVDITEDAMTIEGGTFPLDQEHDYSDLEPETDLSTMPHKAQILGISSEIYYLMHQKDDEIQSNADEDDLEAHDREVEDKLKYWDAQAKKLGYEPAMDLAEYPFVDIHWYHVPTHRLFTIDEKHLKHDQSFRGTVNEETYLFQPSLKELDKNLTKAKTEQQVFSALLFLQSANDTNANTVMPGITDLMNKHETKIKAAIEEEFDSDEWDLLRNLSYVCATGVKWPWLKPIATKVMQRHIEHLYEYLTNDIFAEEASGISTDIHAAALITRALGIDIYGKNQKKITMLMLKAVRSIMGQDDDSIIDLRMVANAVKSVQSWPELNIILKSLNAGKTDEGSVTVNEEGSQDDVKPSRKDNRLWLMISDYEQRAKKTKNDIKRDHYMRMASQLRDKLTVNEKELGDRRSFTVKMEFEDGGKVTRVFLAKDKEEALSKAMKWAKNEYDPEQGVEARIIAEAEYHGRKVQLGKPMAGDVKKYKVYVKDPKTGNVKKVNFGDKGMEIKRDDPKRRKNFRARHGCGTPRASNRTKAAYWSCRLWSTKRVSDILKGK